MKETLEEYIESIATVKRLAESDKQYFGKLNADEQKALIQYYFAYKDPVEPRFLGAYRESQTLNEMDIESRALHALGRLKQNAHSS